MIVVKLIIYLAESQAWACSNALETVPVPEEPTILPHRRREGDSGYSGRNSGYSGRDGDSYGSRDSGSRGSYGSRDSGNSREAYSSRDSGYGGSRDSYSRDSGNSRDSYSRGAPQSWLWKWLFS